LEQLRSSALLLVLPLIVVVLTLAVVVLTLAVSRIGGCCCHAQERR
jgi:hypothetical protein